MMYDRLAGKWGFMFFERTDRMRYGALEAGGTKMVCAVGDENGRILEQISIPTEHPDITLPKIAAYFAERSIQALGIGAFGPINLRKDSPDYGKIGNTPKMDYKGVNLISFFSETLMVPIAIDTDVNAACLGEVRFGAARGLVHVVYLTIGTGIGSGIYLNGQLLHGMLHPEGGHILVEPVSWDPGKSVCPYHSNCLEGLSSGPSIRSRWGREAFELAGRTEVWELEAEYLAQGLMSYILMLSPQKIILGGGVMHQEQLFPLIRERVLQKLNGYYETPELTDMDTYIVPAALAGNQGIIGCLCMAKKAGTEEL